MQIIIKTDFEQDILCEQIKLGDSVLYYKVNSDDTYWQDVTANNVKYIQMVGHRTFH